MKVKILLLAMILGIFLLAQAQPARAYTKSISGDPISLIFGNFNATYEFQTGSNNSLTILGSYYFPSGWNVLGIGASYRWYIVKEKTKRIIEGFSFGPKAVFSFWSSNASDGGIGFSLGGEAAYKWVFGGFVVEPIFNLLFPLKGYGGAGTYVGLGVNLGYAW